MFFQIFSACETGKLELEALFIQPETGEKKLPGLKFGYLG